MSRKLSVLVSCLVVVFILLTLHSAEGRPTSEYPWEQCPSNSLDALQCCACEDSCHRDYTLCWSIAITSAQRSACSAEHWQCYLSCGCEAIFGVAPPEEPPSTE